MITVSVIFAILLSICATSYGTYDHYNGQYGNNILSHNIGITKHVAYPVYQQETIKVPEAVPVPLITPIAIPVPRPFPVHVRVSQPIAVPVVKTITFPVEKTVPYRVEKEIPYHIEKPVPVPVEKHVPVKIFKPVPVKVPDLKVVYHRAKKSWFLLDVLLLTYRNPKVLTFLKNGFDLYFINGANVPTADTRNTPNSAIFITGHRSHIAMVERSIFRCCGVGKIKKEL
ncbi:hypothetical protein NQ317_003737 [Molorchus minor]|uniref:Uncharacterized protein n=1 Tax=Molorchus minor TaxID=1323400 RepID=A0ABQ9JRN0_9CUCU|nr:hypothetical protein NQ317_003737 [Molorchus minor]